MKAINRILCALFGHSSLRLVSSEYRPTCHIVIWKCPRCERVTLVDIEVKE